MQLSKETLEYIERNKIAAVNYLLSLDEKDCNVNAEIAQTMLLLYGLMKENNTEESNNVS